MRKTYKSQLTKAGAIAPLFDRLTDFELSLENEGEPLVFLSPEEMKESISSELRALLNTRAIERKKEKSSSLRFPEGVVFPQLFGLQDFSWADGNTETGRRKIAREIEQIVSYYEPRLANPRVSIRKDPQDPLTLVAEISGDIRVEGIMERHVFPIAIKDLIQRSNNTKTQIDSDK